MTHPWDKAVRLHELARGPVTVQLAPSEAERAQLAKELRLKSLPALTAEVSLKPWLDGAEITGRFDAVVEQVCGVTLDSFEQPVRGEISAFVVPSGSPNAPGGEGGEVELDPDAADPPDVLAGDAVDLAGYVREHLSLELDPFPRKPDAVFDYAPETQVESPFAALKKLQEPKP